MPKKHALVAACLLIVLFFLSGCAEHMKSSSPQEGVRISAGENESVVVFMRPSTLGFNRSSVFEIGDDGERLLGIVAASKKVVYRATPGEHMFMVIGESADFMKANLQAGKTYYALVTPRPGVWKDRFSLKPVTRTELDSEQFKAWYADCEFVESTPGAFQWAKDHGESIRSKKTEYLKKWNRKPDTAKPMLKPDDGL